jgi:lysophospholipase L1-like esterase
MTLRTVMFLGDSVTYVPSMSEFGVTENWVEQLTRTIEQSAGPRAGDGFRGLWHDTEWSLSGTWIETAPTDPFDVTPFRSGRYSSGSADDAMVWTKPRELDVRAFELWSFAAPNIGRFQYRVDDGAWTNITEPHTDAGTLQRLLVAERVEQRVAIRGHDGTQPCVAAVAGISTYTNRPSNEPGLVVHNVGYQQQFLARFCRMSAGNPLALLDELRPELVTLLFTNDVLLGNAELFARTVEAFVTRVAEYCVVLIITPFEQRAVVAGRRDPALQAEYRAATSARARALHCPHVDLYDAFARAAGPGFDAAVAAGLMHDGLHPSQAGNDLIARCVTDALQLPALTANDA